MMPASKGRVGTYRFEDLKSDERLGELILHISSRCEDDPNFGATKLNKILWWSDFLSYARRGKPITGAEYQRLRNGPAPKRLVPVRRRLVTNHDAVVQEREYFKRTQKRVIPLRKAKYDLFTAEDIALVDEVISDLWDDNAATVSEESHGKAWEVAKDKQSIPYEAILLSDSLASPADVEETHSLAEILGWERA